MMPIRSVTSISLVVLVCVFPATVFNACSRGPTAPTGSYPTNVGQLVLLHPDAVNGVQEAGYKGFQFDYGYKEADHLTGIVQYNLRVYPSPNDANSALETDRQQRNNQNSQTTWEDRLDRSGQKLGTMLRIQEGQKQGCTIEYTQGPNMIIILGLASCDDAKKFQKDMPLF